MRLASSAPPAPAPSVTYEYRAKWICNTHAPQRFESMLLNTTSPENIGLVSGEYKTDINVHNPSHSVNLTIVKSFVLSGSENIPSLVRASAKTFLGFGGALRIDCLDIFTTYKNAGVFLCPPVNITCAVKGLVTLDQQTSTGIGGFSSPNSLDVVGEYNSESLIPSTAPASESCISPPFSTTLAGPCTPSGISLDVVTIDASPFVA